MQKVTNEMLLTELLKLEAQLAQVEVAMKAVSVESNRTLWECEMGRQKIDRARQVYEQQVERRLATFQFAQVEQSRPST